MSYDEHLISQAGGDGDMLDQIQRRINDCQTYKFGMLNADKLAHEDAPYLLALVQEQQARIERVEDLCNSWDRMATTSNTQDTTLRATAYAIRAALATPEPTP